eukprot:123194_1
MEPTGLKKSKIWILCCIIVVIGLVTWLGAIHPIKITNHMFPLKQSMFIRYENTDHKSNITFDNGKCDDIFVKQLKIVHKSVVDNYIPYNGEIEILLTRIHEIQLAIDYFVIFESIFSHSKHLNDINQTK